MFSFVQIANRDQLSTVANKETAKMRVEQQLARKGLMVGVSMEQNRVCLNLVGKLNAGNSLLFKELVKTSISNGYTSMTIDLQGLTSLDSAGVAALVAMNVAATEAGGRLTVTNPNTSLFRKLVMVNFHHLVQIESFGYAA
jgi:anti-anti-sigma factor